MEYVAEYYEPPVAEHCDEEAYHVANMQLAPGVIGCAAEINGEIIIPMIVAEKKGNGDVGRFLDSLSPRCVIQSVCSERLKGMLLRRGFQPVFLPGGDDQWRRP